MSRNPRSINYQNPDLAIEAEGNAKARTHAVTEATKANTGNAGLDQSQKAKAAIRRATK